MNTNIYTCSINTYHITVDYNKSLYDLIRLTDACWFNPDINPSRFPICVKPVPRKWFGLLRSHNCTFEEAISQIAHLGCHPASVEELLTFASEYRFVTWSPPIIALGTTGSVNGSCRLVFLHEWGGFRDIRLIRADQMHFKLFQLAFTTSIIPNHN